MKILTAGVVSALLAAGTAGSVAAYRSQAGVDVVTRPAAQETPGAPATTDAQPRQRVRWAPCPAGSVLERGTCVTDVVRTVVLPSTPQPAPASPAGAVRGSDDGADDHGAGTEGSDDLGDDQGDDHADEHADEHADDHGDDHGEDEHADDHGDDHEDEHAEDEHAED
ncbi:hypothetical protein KDN32_11865 [Nocardioides sp. J2M5]|uniref:hypothetical protein n=1 Tax=Nocardioides palaemonis TaxID=2829810 RepID=UPI001BACE69D|nr:hypothetical protein [Nocardioides palaemonis]MBS2938440.1 hypothetical protein [Nocardioides palaemonis]